MARAKKPEDQPTHEREMKTGSGASTGHLPGWALPTPNQRGKRNGSAPRGWSSPWHGPGLAPQDEPNHAGKCAAPPAPPVGPVAGKRPPGAGPSPARRAWGRPVTAPWAAPTCGPEATSIPRVFSAGSDGRSSAIGPFPMGRHGGAPRSGAKPQKPRPQGRASLWAVDRWPMATIRTNQLGVSLGRYPPTGVTRPQRILLLGSPCRSQRRPRGQSSPAAEGSRGNSVGAT